MESSNSGRINCLVYLENRMPEEEILFRTLQMVESMKAYGKTVNVWIHPEKPWMGIDCGENSPEVTAEMAKKIAAIWQRPVILYDECSENSLTIACSDENGDVGMMSRAGKGGLPTTMYRFFPCSQQAEEIWHSNRYALPLDRLFALSEAMKEPVPISLLGKRRAKEALKEYNHLSLCM